ncbi:hypothetical protein GOBAR_DD02357 [Gossypium barbadense]|nr:hypothetical protein GOBAR_DD02357 [Gossypium barbadense]
MLFVPILLPDFAAFFSLFAICCCRYERGENVGRAAGFVVARGAMCEIDRRGTREQLQRQTAAALGPKLLRFLDWARYERGENVGRAARFAAARGAMCEIDRRGTREQLQRQTAAALGPKLLRFLDCARFSLGQVLGHSS